MLYVFELQFWVEDENNHILVDMDEQQPENDGNKEKDVEDANNTMEQGKNSMEQTREKSDIQRN